MAHDLKITCDRNDLIDGALDKVLVDEQKVKLCNETGGEERQGAVQVAVILGDARLTRDSFFFAAIYHDLMKWLLSFLRDCTDPQD